MSELIYAIDDHVVGIYPELVDAIKCVRAQGIKTALLTNNWLKEPGVGHSPVDKSLFDVVSHLTFTSVRIASTNSLLNNCRALHGSFTLPDTEIEK